MRSALYTLVLGLASSAALLGAQPATTFAASTTRARVLQCRFQRALGRQTGYTGPLHGCTFYGSEAAGAKLARMLEAGEYFAPLETWLDQQNAGHPIGGSVPANR
jgi:peptidyl-dipeptidase A